MSIIGYKCFNSDLTNRYGMKFSVGKIYVASGAIKFGNSGNGFHICTNIEDTFRYFDAMNELVKICRVIGSGKTIKYDDEYYGYYDMYAVEKLEIIKEYSHSEIIDIGLNLNPRRVKRFVETFKLTSEEISRFKDKFKNDIDVIDAIAYYQEKDFKAFRKRIGDFYG